MISLSRRDFSFWIYVVYWPAYILVFTLIQGMPAGTVANSFYAELITLLPKILFVLLVTEWLAPKLFETKKHLSLASVYLLGLLCFAVLLRVADNYFVIGYIFKTWTSQPLLDSPPLVYDLVKLQFVVTIPFGLKMVYLFGQLRQEERKTKNESVEHHSSLQGKESVLTVKSDRQNVRIYLDKVLYLEAQGNYLTICTINGDSKIYHSISGMVDKLPRERFVRVHRSFIVAIDKVETFTSSYVHISKKRIPIGRSYGQSVNDVFQPIFSQRVSH